MSWLGFTEFSRVFTALSGIVSYFVRFLLKKKKVEKWLRFYCAFFRLYFLKNQMKKYNENGRLHPRFTRSFFSIFRKFFFQDLRRIFYFFFGLKKWFPFFFSFFYFHLKKKEEEEEESADDGSRFPRVSRRGWRKQKNFKKFQKKTLPKTGAS